MSPAVETPHDGRYPGVIASLTATAVLPFAVILRPPSAPELWLLVPMLLAALAAYSGAARAVPADPTGTASPPSSHARARLWHRPGVMTSRRIAGWAILGLATEALGRAGLLLAWGRPLVDVLGPASLGAATITVAALVAGGWLAERMHRTVTARLDAGEPLGSVAPTLLAGAVLAFAATGWTATDPTATRWGSGVASLATLVFCVLAAAQLQRLRRHGLITRWHARNRTVDREVTARWSAITGLVALVGVLLAAAWWLPPLDRLRGGFSLLAWLIDAHQEPAPPPPGGPVGPLVQVLPEERPDPIEMDATLLALSAVILLGALLLWIWRHRSRRRNASLAATNDVLGRLLRWWRILLATLVAMLVTTRGAGGADGADTRPSQLRGSLGERLRRWGRPSDHRARIVHDYRRTLADAAKHGIHRPASQPARHYAHNLRTYLPDHIDEIDMLTEAFLEARYSHHPIDPRAVDHVHHVSRHLRAALRHRAGV